MKISLALILSLLTATALAQEVKDSGDVPVGKANGVQRLDPVLLVKAEALVKRHSVHFKNALDRIVQRNGIQVEHGEEFPTAKITQVEVKPAEFKVGEKFKVEMQGVAKIEEIDRFAIFGIVAAPRSSSSSGGIARNEKRTVNMSLGSSFRKAETYEVFFVIAAVRLSDHKTKVLDIARKEITVADAD